jgi:hypothetical protein
MATLAVEGAELAGPELEALATEAEAVGSKAASKLKGLFGKSASKEAAVAEKGTAAAEAETARVAETAVKEESGGIMQRVGDATTGFFVGQAVSSPQAPQDDGAQGQPGPQAPLDQQVAPPPRVGAGEVKGGQPPQYVQTGAPHSVPVPVVHVTTASGRKEPMISLSLAIIVVIVILFIAITFYASKSSSSYRWYWRGILTGVGVVVGVTWARKIGQGTRY